MKTISGREAESCELRGHYQTVLVQDLPKRWLWGGSYLFCFWDLFIYYAYVWVHGCRVHEQEGGGQGIILGHWVSFRDGIQGSKSGSQVCVAKGEPYHQHLREDSYSLIQRKEAAILPVSCVESSRLHRGYRGSESVYVLVLRFRKEAWQRHQNWCKKVYRGQILKAPTGIGRSLTPF